MKKPSTEPVPDALAVSIPEAAKRVGLSRSTFYRDYLTNHRLRPIPTGRRGRVIDVRDLAAAYEEWKRERLAAEEPAAAK